MNGWSQVNRRV